MCSIFGVVGKFEVDKLKKANSLMKHRGPDETNYFIENDIFLAHNRLSIIDIKNGHQPFIKDNLVLVFNGEIYNYIELKKLYLMDYEFSTNSDTEVILAMYQKYGVKCLEYFEGMFAFCIYDKNQDYFFCARDRIGEKPFFYSLEGGFIFSSEIAPILEFVDDELDESLEGLYFSSFKHFPAPYTYYKNIKQLKPASYMIVKNNKVLTEQFYWKPKVGNYKKVALLELKRKILDVVKKTARADVKIALLLSGGVDSSIIAYCLKSLNIDFVAYAFGKDKNDEELKRARLVAKHLDIQLNEIYFESDDLEIHKKLIKHYKEPIYLLPLIFAYKLYEKISKDNIKVVLTGNGADELFFGYISHPKTALFSYLFKFKDNVEIKKSRIFKSMLKKDKKILDKLFDEYKEITECFKDNFYIDFTNFFALFLEGALPMTIIGDLCGMEHSVEVRNPFFNHNLIEFAYNIHPNQKIGSYFDKDGKTLKKILKEAFYNDLPKEIFEAKKIGFGGAIREKEIFGENGNEKFANWAMEVFKENR